MSRSPNSEAFNIASTTDRTQFSERTGTALTNVDTLGLWEQRARLSDNPSPSATSSLPPLTIQDTSSFSSGVPLSDHQPIALPGLLNFDPSEASREQQTLSATYLQNGPTVNREVLANGSIRTFSNYENGRTEWDEVASPDGVITLTRYTPDGDNLEATRIYANGDVGTFRWNDGTYVGEIRTADGGIGRGSFTRDLNPIDVGYRYPDGHSRRVVLDSSSGITWDTTGNPDGSQLSVRTRGGEEFDQIFIHDNILETRSRDGIHSEYADRSQTISVIRPDGTTRTERFAPNGDFIGGENIPPNGTVTHLDNGGYLVQLRSPTGSVARTYTVDRNGNYLQETSFDGDGRLRETITYSGGNRTVSQYDQSGNLLGPRRTEPYAAPTTGNAGPTFIHDPYWILRL